MLPKKSVNRYSVLLLVVGCYCVCHVQAKADSSSAESTHDSPVITPNFYDPNYHDDGRNHMRGPTAASSSSTISIMSPYAAASSQTPESYNKGSTSSRGGGTIMAIVDHFYGPNGEEQVKYTNPTQMDKDEFEQILASLGSSGSTPSKLTYNSPSSSSSSSPQHSPKQHHPQYSPSAPKLSPPPPSKYVGAPLSSLYKSSSSPSYTSTHPGFSLGSLYKSSSENTYSNKPPATFRPAFSTIYKDPPSYSPPSKAHHHFSKGSSEYSPSPYGSPKEPILLHSPKEPSFLKGSSYYDSPQTGPKSISDAISADHGYSKGYPHMSSYKGHSNVIDHDEGGPSYPYSHSPPSYPPPPPQPSYMSHHPSHSQQPHNSHDSSSEYAYGAGKYYSSPSSAAKDEYPYGKGSLKAGLHSLPVRYSGPPEYGSPSPPRHHHDAYSSGFGGGYSGEDSSDPYSSRPKGHPPSYMKSPPPSSYSSSPPSHSHSSGHSLSSLYEPLAFDELYNSPKAKPMYLQGGSMSLSKPGLHPGAYALSYGPPVEYHMPPKGIGYTTSSSPYGGPGMGSPKYKGPYRTVTTGPSGYGSNGYGYGKPHSSHHDDEHSKTSNADGLNVAKDEYEEEAKFRRPSLPPPPSAMPPLLLYDHQQPGLAPPPTSASDESLRSNNHLSSPFNSYFPPIHHPHHEDKPTSVEYPMSHHPHHPYHQVSQEINSHPPRHPSHNNNQEDSSEEVHHVHVFEKGFFGKEKRLRGKEKHGQKWKPVVRNYRFGGGSGEGGHGSASMERDARERGRRHGPPPSRRAASMEKTSKRPYHNNNNNNGGENGEEKELGGGKTRPPHYRHGHRHHHVGRRS